MARRDVSEDRKAIYLLGQILLVIGILTFGSVFVTSAVNFGDFSNFEADARSEMLRAIAGMAMFAAGGVLMSIGSAGLAGSGVILDPKQAREDLEPWSRMEGGMFKDAADEAGVDLTRLTGGSDAGDDLSFDEKLRRLHKLREEGILTEDEYQRQKAKILEEA